MISTLNKRDLSRYCDESTGINATNQRARHFEGDRLKVVEFKKSTAEVSAKGGSASGGKAGVVSIVAMLNEHGRVVEAERLEFKEGKNRKI